MLMAGGRDLHVQPASRAVLRRSLQSRPVCAARQHVVKTTAFFDSLFGFNKHTRSVFIVEDERRIPTQFTFQNARSYKEWLSRRRIGGLKPKDGGVEFLELEELVDGETYYVNNQAPFTHGSKALEEEFGQAIEQLEPGLVNMPELRTIKRPDGTDWMELDAVVVGPSTVFIASHKRCVKNDSEVHIVAGRAKVLKDKSMAGDPGLAAFAGKEVTPVFMAETCSSMEVEAKVQAACRDHGMLRFVRNGNTLSVQR